LQSLYLRVLYRDSLRKRSDEFCLHRHVHLIDVEEPPERKLEQVALWNSDLRRIKPTAREWGSSLSE